MRHQCVQYQHVPRQTCDKSCVHMYIRVYMYVCHTQTRTCPLSCACMCVCATRYVYQTPFMCEASMCEVFIHEVQGGEDS